MWCIRETQTKQRQKKRGGEEREVYVFNAMVMTVDHYIGHVGAVASIFLHVLELLHDEPVDHVWHVGGHFA